MAVVGLRVEATEIEGLVKIGEAAMRDERGLRWSGVMQSLQDTAGHKRTPHRIDSHPPLCSKKTMETHNRMVVRF